MEVSQPEWYQQGAWPLVGAISVLIITNAFALWRIIVQNRRALLGQLQIKRIEYVSQQLTEFYNPVYTLLLINQHVFEHFGPQSFPEDDIKRQVAAENWNVLKRDVVLPNNADMSIILRTKSHLVSEADDFLNYLDLNNHLHMYKIFSETPTELYEDYRFPEQIVSHVQTQRIELVQKLDDLKKLK